MTRNEFLDTVNDWYELIEFCNDVGCSYCDDVYSEESMNDDINERLTGMHLARVIFLTG